MNYQIKILEDPREKHFRVTEAFLCKYLYYYYYKLHIVGGSGMDELLMNKLELKWWKSVLRAVDIGVPQGSTLRPRLFAIHVKDFPTALQVGKLDYCIWVV